MAETLSRQEALQALKLIKKLLAEDENATEEELIPASIFNSDLSPFSALATYLSGQQLSAKEIARKLGRSKQFVENSITDEELDNSGTPIPIGRFREDLSVLEAATHELKKQGKTNKAIAAELGKSASSVWIALKRANDKIGGGVQ
mgnify:CR=1 FL=1